MTDKAVTENLLLQTLTKQVIDLQTKLELVEDGYVSLQHGLVNAFKEIGHDFSKIGQVVSSRKDRQTILTNVQSDVQTDEVTHPEEMDLDIQDEIARQILSGTNPNYNQKLIDEQQKNYDDDQLPDGDFKFVEEPEPKIEVAGKIQDETIVRPAVMEIAKKSIEVNHDLLEKLTDKSIFESFNNEGVIKRNQKQLSDDDILEQSSKEVAEEEHDD